MKVNPEFRTEEKALDLYNGPLLELVFRAAAVHREFHNAREVQMSSLISIKTGGCPEDCGYCPQSIKYDTGLNNHGMLSVEEVVEFAKNAQCNGSSRVCMGAAWREVRDNRDFDKVVRMVSEINKMGIEVCATLGMMNEDQAKRLKNAGLYAYNHNLDSGKEFYSEIISTREFDQRLDTIENARKAGISVCSGGIIGMGESVNDRIGMLVTYAAMENPPESIPINALVAVEGTPLENQKPVSTWEMVRMIATARIMFPESIIRLSAGRTVMSQEAQALCFLAGASSVFAGDKLLTTPNPEYNEDMELFEILGLIPKLPFQDGDQPVSLPDETITSSNTKRIRPKSGFSPRKISVD